MRTDATRDQKVNAFKTGARQRISREFTIVANIGDQISNLQGGYALRCFKVPNPFYFIAGDPLAPGEPACLAATSPK